MLKSVSGTCISVLGRSDWASGGRPGGPTSQTNGDRGSKLNNGNRLCLETYDNDDRNHQSHWYDWALAQSAGCAPDRGAGCKTASLRRELSETAGKGASEAAPSPGN